MSQHNYEEDFLKQIYDSQVKMELAIEGMLQIIFNLYDDDGDGVLSYEDYISFISDLMYISTVMNRLNEKEYNYETVLRVSRWSSSNFTSNLFREPQRAITYDIFLQGILHAVSEHKDLPIFGNKMFFNSLMPELLNFFHFYDKIAKRRGWPTVVINDNNNIFDTSNNAVIVTEQFQSQVIDVPEQENRQHEIESIQEELQQVQVVNSTENTTNQLREYQQRRQQEFRQQQEIRQREQQRIQLELQQQRQMQFQEQFREQIETRQQQEMQEQQLVNRQIQVSNLNQLDDNDGFPPLPKEYVLENVGTIKLNKNESGFEPINGEVIIKEFIDEDPENNIVFKFGGRYYLVDTSRIHRMSELSMKDNSIFYGCTCEIEMDWTNPQTWNLLNHVVILNPIYFNMQHLGLPIRYVNLTNIQSILYAHQKKHNYYIIEKPEDYILIPSFASDNVLKHGIGSMSGLHCQSGQMDTVYVIKKFTPEFIE